MWVGGTRFAGRTGGAHSTTDDFVAAVENLCIVRANAPKDWTNLLRGLTIHFREIPLR